MQGLNPHCNKMSLILCDHLKPQLFRPYRALWIMMMCHYSSSNSGPATMYNFSFVVTSVGSTQVPFSIVHFRNTTKIAVQVLALTFCLLALLLSFSLNCELIIYYFFDIIMSVLHACLMFFCSSCILDVPHGIFSSCIFKVPYGSCLILTWTLLIGPEASHFSTI